jgi:NAD+-dependent secondary alcohol dehydrogenase Adh1
MRAARLHSYDDGRLRLDEVAEPEVEGYHDVVVRIGGAGLCRTDLHIVEGMMKDLFRPELPYTLGHENAGWVAAVGDAVTNVAEGDAVIAHPFLSCGVCPACRRGEDMYCGKGGFPGVTMDGGFAGYLRTSDRACLKLAEGTDPESVAAHADAGITAYRAAKKAAAQLPPGSRCAVVGVGGLGHIAVQILKALSPARGDRRGHFRPRVGACGRRRRRPHGEGGRARRRRSARAERRPRRGRRP